MNRFKVGDRVAVYEKRSIGTVVRGMTDGTLEVSLDDSRGSPYKQCHVKQCRKIRKRREIWLNSDCVDSLLKRETSYHGIHVYLSPEDGGSELVRFIEAPRKKEK